MKRMIDEGAMAGALTLIARRDQVVHFEAHGLRDLENARPMEPDTVFFIYSMTKPVTAVATLMLHEEGHFLLDDPVSRFIPEFDNAKVFERETDDGSIQVKDLEREITIHHLLTHTSGVTNPRPVGSPVDRLYARERMFRPDETLEEKVHRLIQLPLAHQPGRGWTYGMSHDVLARIIEIVSGQAFDAFLQGRVFGPLGMADTGFWLTPGQESRLATAYTPFEGHLRRADLGDVDHTGPRSFLAGSGGLVSTAGDYLRFCRMLLGGGELDGTRLLAPRTVAMMARDHLPAGVHFPPAVYPFNELLPGHTMGLGVAVLEDPALAGWPGSPGSYTWAGAASTLFWIDPAEDLIGLVLLKVVPIFMRPLSLFRVLAYQAMVEPCAR